VVRVGITVGGFFSVGRKQAMEADCWGLSMEEMDSLELHAIKQLAERRSNNTGVPSSSSSTSASSSAALKKQHFQQPSPSKSSGNVPPSLHVKLFKEQAGGGGHIGVQTQYNKHLVAALKTVPGHEWDPTRKSVPQRKLVFGFGQFLAWFLFTASIVKKLG
jgi:hypothetical protein